MLSLKRLDRGFPDHLESHQCSLLGPAQVKQTDTWLLFFYCEGLGIATYKLKLSYAQLIVFVNKDQIRERLLIRSRVKRHPLYIF